MTRILIHVEGQTEETFVNEVLRPHLFSVGYHSVSARIVGNSRLRANRGGIKSWDVVSREIHRHLSADMGVIASTMVDYYALPHNWPGRAEAATLPHEHRAQHVHQAILNSFAQMCPHSARFEPFVIMHEFEALLFSDCEAFAHSIGMPNKAPILQNIKNIFPNPEYINDGFETSPSRRVSEIFPGYSKPLFGNVGAVGIGLEKICEECPNFSNWISRLVARVIP